MEQNEQKQFQCTGDCLRCTAAQRAYCASQHTYNSMKMIEQMREVVTKMEESLVLLSEKIEAIQSSEASIFDPSALVVQSTSQPEEDIAQEASGASEKTAEIINNL